MKVLNVFYESHFVGKLTRDEELIFGFTYDDDWRSNPKAFPLSIAMPLSQRSFGNRITLSFFENLLPEGEVKEHLQRSHNISGVFDFLEHYGKDCAGAIIVTDQPSYVHSINHNKWTQIDMNQVFSAIEERRSVADVIANMNPGYLSLAGAQDKFAAIYKDGTFLIPTHGAPTTHIVKAPIQHTGIKESVINEYYCMKLAKAVGFNVPKCSVLDGKHPLFIIERYDRFQGKDGQFHRIHQQDFCQAQGKTSEFKYEDRGGPSLKDNYHLIIGNVPARKRIESIAIYFDWICFNLLIGNHDSHSKNISFLLHNMLNELAPVYDLICTAIYPKLRRELSFKIGDRYEFSKIGINQIKMLEEDLGLKEGTFQQHLAAMNDKVHQHKGTLAEQICSDFPAAKIPKRISALIDDRTKSLQVQGAL